MRDAYVENGTRVYRQGYEGRPATTEYGAERVNWSRVAPDPHPFRVASSWELRPDGTERRDGETLYRFVGTAHDGEPNALETVTEARAVLLVDGDGLVRRYEARFAGHGESAPPPRETPRPVEVTVRHVQTYAVGGDVAVVEPEWATTAENRTGA